MIEIDVNIPEVTASLKQLAYDQVPFATSQALNQVAKRAQAAQSAGIQERFTVRRAARLRTSTQIYERSTKRTLETTLSIRDPFLIQHEEGGIRHRGDVYRSLIQPVAERERRVGVLRGRTSPRGVLSTSKAFVARMKNGKVGVFRRVGRKRLPIELVFAFEREVNLGRGRLKFGVTVEGVVTREWEQTFGAALSRAIATAR